MADVKRRTESLRDVEQRLKRALELRGAQDLDLGQVVVPVVLAQDATAPGWRQQIERAWSFAQGNAIAAKGHLFVKAGNRAMLIEKCWGHSTVASGLRISTLATPSDPVVIGVLNTRWAERATGPDEIAPVITAYVDDANDYGTPIFQTGPTTGVIEYDAEGLVLEPGGKLIIAQNDIAGGFFFASVKGKIL